MHVAVLLFVVCIYVLVGGVFFIRGDSYCIENCFLEARSC